MPNPINYSGSLNEFQDDLGDRQNFGGAGFLKKGDPLLRALTKPIRSSPPLLCYPIDLGSSPEYQFSIRFDIWETGGTTLAQKRSSQVETAKAIQKAAAEAPPEEGGNLSFGQFTTLAGAALNVVGDVVNAATSGKVGGAKGKGRDSFVEEATGLTNLTTQVSSVYMYLPGAISISYKIDYEDADLSALDILKGLRSLTETQTGAGKEAQAEIARKMGMSALKVADDVAELVGGKEGLTNALNAQQRQVINPFVVHMFKGVGRRQFRFAFTMIPRSEEEALVIENIVTTFRKYALPHRSQEGRFLDFPAEFNLTFLHRNRENIRMPKILKCALTGINLNYGETTFTATQTDSLGMVSPTKITMELEFSELEILTQQRVEQGA